MLKSSVDDIDSLLAGFNMGDAAATEQLLPLIYEELRRMARGYMRGQPSEHTMQTTELIHEAYMKIARQGEQHWQNRAHFFGVAAKAMRHILVDYARSKHRQKRGGWQERILLDDDMIGMSMSRSEDLLALDDALEKLAALDARKGRVVEMKYFGGLNTEEIAQVLKVSPDTVKRDWRFARNWLLRELNSTKNAA